MLQKARRSGLAWVLLVHVVLVLRLVSLPDLAGSRPLGAIDYQSHYYEAMHARQRLHRDGSLLGYDPYLMVGYPEGTFGWIENRLFYLALAATPAGSEAVVFNFSVLVLLMTIPLASVVAARAAGQSAVESVASAALASVATFTIPIVVKCWMLGMVSFLVASVWFVPAIVLLARALAVGSLSDRHARLGLVFAAFSTIAHAASAVLFAPGLVVAAIPALRRSVRVVLPLIAAIAAVFALFNVPAVLALADLRGELDETLAQRFLQGGIRQLGDDLVFRLLHTVRTRDTGLGGLGAILILACAVPVHGKDSLRGSGTFAPLAWASGFVFFALAYLSSRWETFSSVQPYRFLVPLAFLLCLPAGRGLVRIVSGAARGGVGAIAGAGVALLFVVEAARALVPLAAIGTGVDPGEASLVRFLREHTSPTERILVESSGVTLPAFTGTKRQIFSARFAMLPFEVEREYVGYILPGAILRQSYAGFVFGKVLGRPLEGMRQEDMRALLQTYAISWVVGWLPEGVRGLRSQPAVLEEVADREGVVVFRVRDPRPSRVLEGQGEVHTVLDRIEVRAAAGERVVLKYHWAPTLRTEPPLAIEEAPVAGSPVGFIAVRPAGRSEFAVVP